VLEAVGQVRAQFRDVVADGLPCVGSLNDQTTEVLVEHVTHHAHGQFGLPLEQCGGLAGALEDRGRPLVDGPPLSHQSLDVGGQLLLTGALGGRAHDDAGVVGDDPLEDLLQARPLVVGELAGDAGHRAARDEHEVAARQGDLAGQTRALVPDGILSHLHQDRVPAGERVLDAARPSLHAGGVPVDLTGVEHGVAPLAQVDEGRLHGGQHVLDAADVDVADHRGLRAAGDVVLDEQPVLEQSDLVEAVVLTHDHLAVHAFTAGQELSLGDDGATAPGRAALAAALTLGLQARRPLERSHLVARVPAGVRAGARARTTATTTSRAALLGVGRPVPPVGPSRPGTGLLPALRALGVAVLLRAGARAAASASTAALTASRAVLFLGPRGGPGLLRALGFTDGPGAFGGRLSASVGSPGGTPGSRRTRATTPGPRGGRRVVPPRVGGRPGLISAR